MAQRCRALAALAAPRRSGPPSPDRCVAASGAAGWSGPRDLRRPRRRSAPPSDARTVARSPLPWPREPRASPGTAPARRAGAARGWSIVNYGATWKPPVCSCRQTPQFRRLPSMSKSHQRIGAVDLRRGDADIINCGRLWKSGGIDAVYSNAADGGVDNQEHRCRWNKSRHLARLDAIYLPSQ